MKNGEKKRKIKIRDEKKIAGGIQVISRKNRCFVEYVVLDIYDRTVGNYSSSIEGASNGSSNRNKIVNISNEEGKKDEITSRELRSLPVRLLKFSLLLAHIPVRVFLKPTILPEITFFSTWSQSRTNQKNRLNSCTIVRNIG